MPARIHFAAIYAIYNLRASTALHPPLHRATHEIVVPLTANVYGDMSAYPRLPCQRVTAEIVSFRRLAYPVSYPVLETLYHFSDNLIILDRAEGCTSFEESL